jgi:hypothetical protein
MPSLGRMALSVLGETVILVGWLAGCLDFWVKLCR